MSNLAGQLIVLAVVASLCVYAWARGITTRGDTVIYLLAPLFAVSFAVVALLPRNGLYAADVIAGSGYATLRLLLWTTIVRLSYRHPEHLHTQIALVATATTLGSQLGFEVAQYLAVHGVEVPAGLACLVATLLCGACCLTVAPGYRSIGRNGPDRLWLLGSNPASSKPSSTHAAPVQTKDPQAPIQPPASHDSPRPALASFASYYGLSHRETQIVAEASRGYTMAVIANKVGLSGNTVRTYMRRVYVKCGVDNKQQLLELMDAFNTA